MKYSEALKLMKQGAKVKLPSWGGYWFWYHEKETVIIHTKEGKELDIRETERVEYTTLNVASEDWIIADDSNCPELDRILVTGIRRTKLSILSTRLSETKRLRLWELQAYRWVGLLLRQTCWLRTGALLNRKENQRNGNYSRNL